MRGPVSHIQNWTEAETKRRTTSILVDLVARKAAEFFLQWDVVLQGGHLNGASFCFLFEIEDRLSQAEWVSFAVLCACEALTDFFVRVVLPCRSHPRLLLWMVHAPHDVVSEPRRDLCKDLLSTDESEDAIRKIVLLWRPELEMGANTGRVPKQFYDVMRNVAEHLPARTQDSEGLSGESNHDNHVAPHVRWELMSSRTTARREFLPKRCKGEVDHIASFNREPRKRF